MERKSLLDWLNEETTETVLQRDDVFAMLTWKDLNQAQPVGLSAPVVASLFVMGAILPLVLFH